MLDTSGVELMYALNVIRLLVSAVVEELMDGGAGAE